jgi:hypothetical protein
MEDTVMKFTVTEAGRKRVETAEFLSALLQQINNAIKVHGLTAPTVSWVASFIAMGLACPEGNGVTVIKEEDLPALEKFVDENFALILEVMRKA